MVTGRKRNFSWSWWLLGVILVSAIIGAVVVARVNYFNKEEDTDGSTVTIVETSDVKVEEKSPEEVQKVESSKKQDVKQYDGESPNVTETLTGVITYAAVNWEKLMIRININQYLEEGVCALTLKQAGNIVYSSTAGIIGSVATATCEGFDIPTTELPSGEMQIMISLDANGKTGEINGEVKL